MIQDLIAYLIISIAFGALILHILRFFNMIGKKSVNTSKCGGCSTGCEMKELHQIKKPKNYDQYRIQL
jgi:hypothetical protein